MLPKRDRRRAEREGADAAKRAQRRARMGALDQGLELAGLWFRDVACVADGVPDLVYATDRLGALTEDAAGRDAHCLRRAVALVDEARAGFILYPNEELLLEALASRLARTVATG
jgi:hypothetical protein